jgi:hypothetical protein
MLSHFTERRPIVMFDLQEIHEKACAAARFAKSVYWFLVFLAGAVFAIWLIVNVFKSY